MDRRTRAVGRLVGARLRRERLRHGASQAALGRAIGRDRTTVSRWESGRRLPSLAMLVDVADALDCPLGALVEEAERAR